MTIEEIAADYVNRHIVRDPTESDASYSDQQIHAYHELVELLRNEY